MATLELGCIQPNPYLFNIENRQKRKAHLAHELGAGARCKVCGDKCPGFELHFWRKYCMNCRCGKDDHEVEEEEEDIGKIVVGKLFERPLRTMEDELKFSYGNALEMPNSETGQKEKVTFDWIPPGITGNLASRYMQQLPPEKRPVAGSEAARKRRKQLEEQIPLYDMDEALRSESLPQEELQNFMSYLERIRSIAGQGYVQEITLSQPEHAEKLISFPKMKNSDQIKMTKQKYEVQTSVLSNQFDQEGNIISKCDDKFPKPVEPCYTKLDVENRSSQVVDDGHTHPNSISQKIASKESIGDLFAGSKASREIASLIAPKGFHKETSSYLPVRFSSLQPASHDPLRTSCHAKPQVEQRNEASGQEQLMIPSKDTVRTGTTSDQPQNDSAKPDMKLNKHVHDSDDDNLVLMKSKPSPLGTHIDSENNTIVGSDKSPSDLKSVSSQPVKGSMSALPSLDPKKGPISSSMAIQEPYISIKDKIVGGYAVSHSQGVHVPIVSESEPLYATPDDAITSLRSQFKCQKCGEILIGGDVAVSCEHAGKNKFWHPTCFVCYSCGELLQDLIYFYREGKIYCGRHYSEAENIPRCKGCDELIFGDSWTRADDSDWHLQHFCCYICDLPLAGQRYVPSTQGHPYCLNCYMTCIARMCETCEEKISPDATRCSFRGYYYHGTPECFKCKKCSKVLLGQKFKMAKNWLFCSMECSHAMMKEIEANPNPKVKGDQEGAHGKD